MNMNEQIGLLRVPLPEDIEKHKWHGDFQACGELIDRKLALPTTSDVMRRRLLLEKKILLKMPRNYPYTWEEACALLAAEVKDFTDEDLKELMDSDYADWIYVDGEVHFRNNLVSNTFKTRPDFAARRIRPQGQSEESRQLKTVLKEMREEGGARRTIRLRAKLWLAEDAAVPGEKVRVWLPLPEKEAQIKDVRILDDGTDAMPEGALSFCYVAPENAPQRTICWEAAWQPGLSFTAEYEYDIENGWLDLWNGLGEDGSGEFVPPENVAAWKEKYFCDEPVTEEDLAFQEPHIVPTPMLSELLKEIVGQEKRPLEKARLIYNYVTTQIHYSYMRSYVTLPDIAEYVARTQKGDCGAQTILFMTLCRMAGIPARWQSGLIANPGYVGAHDWCRIYIEEYGWIFADCSFGGGANRSGDEWQRRFYFGNLDPYRMCACSRFQTPFMPAMEKLRSDPYDNQSGEVERERDEDHDRYAYDSETVMVSCV